MLSGLVLGFSWRFTSQKRVQKRFPKLCLRTSCPLVRAPLVSCVLHNFLGNGVICAPDLNVEPNPAASFLSCQAASRGGIGAVGAAVRDKLCSFFNHMGAVPW